MEINKRIKFRLKPFCFAIFVPPDKSGGNSNFRAIQNLEEIRNLYAI